MSAEMNVLDYLLGGDEPLDYIRRWCFDSDEHLARAIHRRLYNDEVQILAPVDIEVPRWQWRELFIDGTVFTQMTTLRLHLTDTGARRVG